MKKIIFALLLFPSILFGQATGKYIVNKATGGTVIIDTLNAASLLNLHQTTAGQTITIASIPSGGKTIDVVNIGSVDLTLSPGGTLSPAPAINSRAQLRWTGSTWGVTLGGGSGSGLDTSAIHKTGNEVKRSGILTFVVPPSVPTPVLSPDAANKGYVDTKAGAKQDTGKAFYKDGSILATGDFDLNSHDLKRVNGIKDPSGVYAIVPSTRLLKDVAGNTILNFQNQSNGIGIGTGGGGFVFIKADNLTTNRTLQAPNQGGTLALTTDIPASVDTSLLVHKHVGSLLFQNPNTTGLSITTDNGVYGKSFLYLDSSSGELGYGPSTYFYVDHTGSTQSSASGIIELKAAGLKVTDSRVGASQKGLEYGADYSSHYSSRSLVDKAYATSLIPSSLPPSGSAGGDLTGTYPNPTVGSAAITFLKMQNIASGVLIGRSTAGSGSPESIAVGSGLSLSAGTLSATGSAPTGSASGDLGGTYPGPTVNNSAVIGKVLTGYTSSPGTVSASDNILQAFQKINGNVGVNTTNIASNTASILHLRKFKVFPNTIIEGYGDSYMQSFLASPTTNGFYPILATSLGYTTANQGQFAVGGTGWDYIAKTSNSSLVLANQKLLLACAGLNDMRRADYSNLTTPPYSYAKTYNKIICGVKSFLCNAFMSKTCIAANNASVTTAGTWTTTSGMGDKASGRLTGLVRTSSVSGSTLSYTFTGTNIVVGTFGCDGVTVTHGGFTVSIDGTTVDTYSPIGLADAQLDGNSDANTIVPNTLIYTGLGNNSHTIVITTTSNTPTYIDYFGQLQSPNLCSPVLILGIPTLDATGYSSLTPSIPSTAVGDTLMSRGRQAILAGTSYFNGYPVTTARFEDYWNPATDLNTDHVHPSNSGYKKIALDAINYFQFGDQYNAYVQNPAILWDGSSSNRGYVANSGDNFVFANNFNPVSGATFNAAKYLAGIYTNTAGDGTIQFWRSTSAGGSVIEAGRFSKTGFLLNTTAAPYRMTNAGSDVNPFFIYDAGGSSSTAGATSYFMDNTNGFGIARANGTRRISRVNFTLTNNSDVAGSESSDYSINLLNGAMAVNGGYKPNRTTVSDANYSILAKDFLIAYTSLTVGRTATLPAPSATYANQTFTIKDESGGAGTNNITVAGTIDGAVNYIINTNYGSVTVYCNGTAYFKR
jgi:hypothetical protein